MLQKPDITDETITGCLLDAYGLAADSLEFLPLGGDVGTAVYRVTADGDAYFCKLRRGEFDESTVALPRYLHDNGVTAIIAPITAASGQLSAPLGEFRLILYPFVVGIEGYTVELSARQWAEFGAAVRQIHDLPLPASLRDGLRRESFSAEWREECRAIMRRVANTTSASESLAESSADPVTAQMAAMWLSRRDEILAAIDRADELATVLSARRPDFVLCHTDLHPGNLLIDESGKVFIVDWDYPMLAPREMDLMFIGGGQGYLPFIPEQEERLFYAGYGPWNGVPGIDPLARTYFLYNRGLMDMTVESERILSPTLGQADREQALEYLGYYWLAGNTLEMAGRADAELVSSD